MIRELGKYNLNSEDKDKLDKINKLSRDSRYKIMKDKLN